MGKEKRVQREPRSAPSTAPAIMQGAANNDPVQRLIDSLPDSGKVTVACKLPNGLILRLFNMVDKPEPMFGGGHKSVKMAEPIPGAQVRLHGNAVPMGVTPVCNIVAGFAMTPKVDAAFMKEWFKQNREHDAVKSGLIWAFTSAADANAQAVELRELKSGFEPINPAKDSRMPKPQNPFLKPLEAADEMKGRIMETADDTE